jgi:lysozyme family protein
MRLFRWLKSLFTPKPTPTPPVVQPSPKPESCLADQLCDDHDRDFKDPTKPEVSVWTPEAYRHEYIENWLTMEYPVFLSQAHTNGRRQNQGTVDWTMRYIETHKARYQKASGLVKEKLGYSFPWELIAALHIREAGGDFKKNMMNGQPLNMRTTWVPKGYGPWSNWEDSVVDAFKIKQAPDRWTIANTLYYAERFNGLGYRTESRRRIVGFSPYIWAYSDKYKGGYFVSDGKFDSRGVALGVGVAVILKLLNFTGE